MFTNHVIVIDDFYPNPNEIYFIANNFQTEESRSGNYSGVMTLNEFYTQEHQKIFHHITNSILFPATQLNGKFRFTTVQDDPSLQHIHFDTGQNIQWAAIVYLQKPEHYSYPNNNGTRFWTHKKTNLSSIPLTQEGIEAHGWKGYDDLKNFLETDGLDESLWNETLSVPYKYNRLVMFRPWLFHSPGISFGTSKENCRLIQTFFLG